MTTPNQSAQQRAIEAVQDGGEIVRKRWQHKIFCLLVHLLNLGLFNYGYLIALLLWWGRYKRRVIPNALWMAIFTTWNLAGTLILIQSKLIYTDRWGVWSGVPLLVVPLLTEWARFVIWGLHKMRPMTLEEKIKELTAKLEGHERIQSEGASVRNLDDAAAQGQVFLGTILRSDSFDEASGIIKTKEILGIQAKPILFQNLLIHGAIGSGKTTLLLRLAQQILASTELDLFVVDGKGDEELAQGVATLVKRHRKAQTPIFRLGKDHAGALYNPFMGSADAIYNRLCAMSGTGTQEGNAQFFGRRNMFMLQLICKSTQGAPRSFAELQKRISLNWMLDAYKKDRETSDKIRNIDKSAFGEFQGLIEPVARDFEALTDPTGFTLEDARHAVFSIATSAAGQSAKELTNILIEDIKHSMVNRLKRPSFWIIDEFLALKNKSLADVLILGRSRGVGVALAMQNIDSVIDKEMQESILSNCTTKILMYSDKPETLIKLAGTAKGVEIGQQIEEGTVTGVGTARIQDQYRIDPNEVRKLRAGEAFVLRKGQAAKIKVSQVLDLPLDPSAELIIQKPKREEAPPAPQVKPKPPKPKVIKAEQPQEQDKPQATPEPPIMPPVESPTPPQADTPAFEDDIPAI